MLMMQLLLEDCDGGGTPWLPWVLSLGIFLILVMVGD